MSIIYMFLTTAKKGLAQEDSNSQQRILGFMFMLGWLKTYREPAGHAIHYQSLKALLTTHTAQQQWLCFAPDLNADPIRTTQMLILHNLGEAEIGDIVTYRGSGDLENRNEKPSVERKALAKFYRRLVQNITYSCLMSAQITKLLKHS